MTDNEKAKTLYEDIVNCSSFAKLQAIATQLSELIHCHKHRKVGDGYVLSILCAMRNAIWDSEESNNSYWHTGTPTEEGWYLLECNIGNSDETYYVTDHWNNEVGYWTVNRVIRWQKIEPYRG